MIDIARKTPVVEGLTPDQIPFDDILAQQQADDLPRHGP
jgi:hypothetical protein